jgi:hypothetical protein
LGIVKIVVGSLFGIVVFALGYLTRDWRIPANLEKETRSSSLPAPSDSTSPRNPQSLRNDVSAEKRIWNDLSRPMKERFSDLLSLTDSEEREIAFQTIMKNMDSTIAPEIVTAIREASARGIDCRPEWGNLFVRWGHIDPEGALSFLKETDTSEWGRFATSGATDGLMRGWGRKNPGSALASIDSGLINECYRGVVFESWVQADHQAALARMMADRGKDYGDYGRNFDLIASEICREEGLEALFDTFKEIKSVAQDDLELQRHAGQAVASRLGHAPVETIVGWLLKEAADNPELGKELVNNTYQNVEVYYPDRSMEILAELAEGSLPIDILHAPILTETRRNPMRVGNWLNEHVGEASFDPIRASYVQSLLEIDPTSARKWAETISDPELRAKSLKHSVE